LVGILNIHRWNKKQKRDLLLFVERIVNLKGKIQREQYTTFLKQETKEGRAVYVPLIFREKEAEMKKQIQQANKRHQQATERLQQATKRHQQDIERHQQATERLQQNQLETAKNLLRYGDSPEKVAKCTKLPLKRIRELQKEL
jgi:hypothetical protein